MFKSLFLPILGVCFFIVIVGLLNQGKIPLDNFVKQNSNSSKRVITINNKDIEIEISKSNEERARGLSNRTSLEENSGMIFVFSNDRPIFWMKDTKIPLDIIWINDNRIIGIDKDVPVENDVSDEDLNRYPSPSEVDYVLEVNAGFADKFGIKVGQMISGLEQL